MMRVRIKRQDEPGSEPYWQTFLYEKQGRETVAGILEHLNYRDDLVDEQGRPCRRIRWECSCMQKMCGACAMVVNHEPVLACNRFVDTAEMQELVIEPLTKFPVVTDLCVDRSAIERSLRDAGVYLGEAKLAKAKEFEQRYEVAKCLKCGLCLEVCPNYVGETRTGGTDAGAAVTDVTAETDGMEHRFYGAVMANESYLMYTTSADRGRELKKA